MGWKKYFVPAALVYTVTISVLMAVLTPIVDGYRYDIAIKLSLSLAVIWILYKVKPDWAFRKGTLILAVLAGLGLGIGSLVTINPDAEIIKVYRTVFIALDSGKNPYACGSIYHDVAAVNSEAGGSGQTPGVSGQTRHPPYRTVPHYGNFNYPPMEIYPYYLGRLVTGTWNSAVLTGVILILHSFACLIMLMIFPGIRRKYVWPFFPLFLFTEIKTNPAMTLLLTALILWAIKRDQEKPRRGYRYLIAVLFGVGLMTKFLVIPLMAAYYWHKFNPKKLRSLLNIAVDAGIALATAILIMAPFGVATVFKETVLFNLILKDRAAMATFFPNVLSGPLSWAHLGGLYSVVAVVILGAAILTAPRLSLYSALLAATFTFLFVAPTPEPQFVPVMLYLALAGIYAAAERKKPATAGVQETGLAETAIAPGAE